MTRTGSKNMLLQNESLFKHKVIYISPSSLIMADIERSTISMTQVTGQQNILPQQLSTMPVCSVRLTEDALESICHHVSRKLFILQGTRAWLSKNEGTELAPQDAPGPVKRPHGPVNQAEREIPVPNDSRKMAARAVMDPPPCWQET